MSTTEVIAEEMPDYNDRKNKLKKLASADNTTPSLKIKSDYIEHTLDSIRETNEKENENVRAARLTM